MAVEFDTSRGRYRLSVAGQESVCGAASLTLSAEHAGGLEKFAFRCIIASALLQRVGGVEAAPQRLAGWLERQFEQIREAALKSIRSERRLAEFGFDPASPGPF